MGRVRIQEGKLELTIDAQVALKWDEHPALRKGIARLAGSKAVDVAVLGDDGGVALIELKDFRGHRIKNKRRVSAGDLALEVAAKVRDTLVGLTWSHGRAIADGATARLVAGLYARGNAPKILVVLWLEEDRSPDAPQVLAIQDEIRGALRPIVAKVVVTSQRVERESKPHARLHWLKVSDRR